MQNKNEIQTAPLIRVNVNPQGTTTTNLGTFTSRQHYVTSSQMVQGDHKTPNNWSFGIKIRTAGPIVATYYSKSSNTHSTFSGSYTMIPDGLAYPEFTTAAQTARAAALNQLLENIRSSDLDLSIDAFQADQTAGMGNNVNRIVRRIRDLQNIHGPRLYTSAMRTFGSAWLMFQYGIKPTLQSIYDTVAFSRQHYNNALRPYTGKSTQTWTKQVNLPGWPDSGYWTAKATLQGSNRHLFKCRLQIPDNTLTQAARLTSLNPVSIAWELVPFSFVADWFVDIGGYLRDTETVCVFGQYWAGGFETASHIVQSVATAERSGGLASGDTYFGFYQSTGTDKGSTRSILFGLPFPSAPRFKPNLGSSQLLNGAALLTQLLR